MGQDLAPKPPTATRGWQKGPGIGLVTTAAARKVAYRTAETARSGRLTCSRGSAMLRQLWTGLPFGAASGPVAASLTIGTTQGLGR